MQASQLQPPTAAAVSAAGASVSSLHMPQKRSALACLPCRTAKNKCDGVPPPLIAELSSHLETKIPNPTGEDVQLRSDQACTRCARLRLECLWQPSHRTGRPRKRARVQEASAEAPISDVQASTATNWPAQQNGGDQPAYPSAAQPAADLDSTAAMMMDLFEQSQNQPDGSMPFSDSMSSFQLSESELIALLNSSPFDSSRAAIGTEQDEPITPSPQTHLSLPPAESSRDPPFDSMQASTLSNQLITSLHQIVPPSCPQPGFQQTPTADDQPSPALSSVLPDASAGASSRARSQLSALRARLHRVSKSPPPTTPRASTVDVPSVMHFGEAKDKLLRYIRRADSNASVDDSIDAAVLDNGLKLYFSGFAKTVPLLGDATEFESTVLNVLPRQNSVRRLLSRVVATLGYLVSTANLVSEHERSLLLQKLRSEASKLLHSCLDRIGSHPLLRLDDLEALALLQSCLLLAYDSYGQNQLSDAEATMRVAVNLALKLRLNQMDAPLSSDMYGSRPPLSEAHAESLRRAWWELYLCDLMFGVTTSGRIRRCVDTANLEVAVHTPLDPGFAPLPRHTDLMLGSNHGGQNIAMKAETFGEADIDRKVLSQAYDVRIRTCALIHECVKVPEDPNEPDFERIRAIDTMLSNIMVVAQRHWATASTHGSASGHNAANAQRNQDERVRWANDTRIEVLFTAMTMLHASRIHLHRLAWFHDLTMDFSSCSFKKFGSTAERVHAAAGGPGSGAQAHASPSSMAARHARRQSMLSTSVTRIVSSADAIMRLVRLDQRMSSPSTWTNTGRNGSEADTQAYVAGRLPAHWPFLGCCNMVAAFGYVVAVAASGPEESNLPTYGDEIRLYDDEDGVFSEGSLVQSDGYGLSSSAPSWQHCSPPANPNPSFSAASPSFASASGSITASAAGHGTVSTTRKRDTMVWKLRAAISNIGFAESTLSQYAHIWPICAVYQHEVALCRSAIDSTGPTGLQ